MRARVGTSGWQYSDWKNAFYPADLPAAERLIFYARRFDTVEVNSTFYRHPRASTVARWLAHVPEGFAFAVKVHRRVTHEGRLKPARKDLERALETVGEFGTRRAPVLLQLPPGFRKDFAAVRRAARLFRGLDPAFEFRHRSWFDDPDLEDRLLEAGAVAVTVDAPPFRTPLFARGPFAYLRLHGRRTWYADAYEEGELRERAREAREALGGTRTTLWVYFNNTVRAHAPRDAENFRRLLETG